MQLADSEGARVRQTRFHGRVEREAPCSVPGCDVAGEFRAPAGDGRRAGFDGPGDWRWLCLDHVRAFNGGYNYFAGMTSDEIAAEQRPTAGWERETRAFSAHPHVGPRWADFRDPLEAISARMRPPAPGSAHDGTRPLSPRDRESLRTLGLEADADRMALRRRYSELVRRYHPDRNGGDRSHEDALRRVIAAYQQLRRARAFG